MSQSNPEKAALATGGVLAVLAFASGLGPLLLVSVGVSGAWIRNLSLLEPCRPLFMGVALDVPGMTYAVCPITVKKALTRVDGVIEATVEP